MGRRAEMLMYKHCSEKVCREEIDLGHLNVEGRIIII
jgi:hypothetical protein